MKTQRELWWNRAKNNAAMHFVLLCSSKLFRCSISLRKFFYKKGIFPSTKLPVPVVVVGNITLGGTGKTPIVNALAKALSAQGYKVGIVSRGYGGSLSKKGTVLNTNHQAFEVGDEPLLHFWNAKVPVAIGKNRAHACQLLLKQHPEINLIISDDGLQHYALQRDFEIIVLDRTNLDEEHLFPLGYLREPKERLKEVDFILSPCPIENAHCYERMSKHFVRLSDDQIFPLDYFEQQQVNVIAGIAKPERFFTACVDLQMKGKFYPFPDHHPFIEADLAFASSAPIIMTLKDAVKCSNFKNAANMYALVQEVHLPPLLIERITQVCERK